MTEQEQHELLAAFLRYVSLQEGWELCFFRDDGSLDGKWLPCPDYMIRRLAERYLAWRKEHAA